MGQDLLKYKTNPILYYRRSLEVIDHQDLLKNRFFDASRIALDLLGRFLCRKGMAAFLDLFAQPVLVVFSKSKK
jgi:hypothetical protein